MEYSFESVYDWQTIYNQQLSGSTDEADILSGDESDDYIFGAGGDDVINGGEGNDFIYGEFGNDMLSGEAGNDYLSGVSYGTLTDYVDYSYDPYTYEQSETISSTIVSEIDSLSGGLGADTFVLGDSTGIHYYNYSIYDGLDYSYAIIDDFNSAEGDKIQVYGDIADYALTISDWTGDGTTDTLIHYQGDAIALVSNASNLNLTQDFQEVTDVLDFDEPWGAYNPWIDTDWSHIMYDSSNLYASSSASVDYMSAETEALIGDGFSDFALDISALETEVV